MSNILTFRSISSDSVDLKPLDILVSDSIELQSFIRLVNYDLSGYSSISETLQELSSRLLDISKEISRLTASLPTRESYLRKREFAISEITKVREAKELERLRNLRERNPQNSATVATTTTATTTTNITKDILEEELSKSKNVSKNKPKSPGPTIVTLIEENPKKEVKVKEVKETKTEETSSKRKRLPVSIKEIKEISKKKTPPPPSSSCSSPSSSDSDLIDFENDDHYDNEEDTDEDENVKDNIDVDGKDDVDPVIEMDNFLSSHFSESNRFPMKDVQFQYILTFRVKRTQKTLRDLIERTGKYKVTNNHNNLWITRIKGI